MTNTLESPTATRAARDTRDYWRVLLAVCAPVGWLVVGISGLFIPYPMGGSVEDNIDGIDRHRDLMFGLLVGQPLFVLTFVPGVIALIMACRRVKPVFTAVLGTLGILGGLGGAMNPPIDLVILTGLEEGIDRGQLADLVDALSVSPATWALLPTLIFITFGRIAMGVLLWQAGVGPKWLAVTMMVSPFVEFVPLGLSGNVQPGISWILSGVAMCGVSLALLRMENDQFDLPPLGAASAR